MKLLCAIEGCLNEIERQSPSKAVRYVCFPHKVKERNNYQRLYKRKVLTKLK